MDEIFKHPWALHLLAQPIFYLLLFASLFVLFFSFLCSGKGSSVSPPSMWGCYQGCFWVCGIHQRSWEFRFGGQGCFQAVTGEAWRFTHSFACEGVWYLASGKYCECYLKCANWLYRVGDFKSIHYMMKAIRIMFESPIIPDVKAFKNLCIDFYLKIFIRYDM